MHALRYSVKILKFIWFDHLVTGTINGKYEAVFYLIIYFSAQA